MLILSRKEDESIIIGDNIKIKIVSIDKGSVKIGFDAPANMLILREELKEAVADINKQADKEVDNSELKALGGKLKR